MQELATKVHASVHPEAAEKLAREQGKSEEEVQEAGEKASRDAATVIGTSAAVT